jgi:putative FmdB family regulatory protein
MPLYDFRCEKCGNIIERSMSFEESEKGIKCPLCKDIMERQFSTGNIIGINHFMQKPGMDAAQSRERARKSLEKRKYQKLNKGGIL